MAFLIAPSGGNKKRSCFSCTFIVNGDIMYLRDDDYAHACCPLKGSLEHGSKFMVRQECRQSDILGHLSPSPNGVASSVGRAVDF